MRATSHLSIALFTTALLGGSVAVVGIQEGEADERLLFVGNGWRTGDVDDHFAGLVAAEGDAASMAVSGYSVVVLQGDIPWKKRTVDAFFGPRGYSTRS